MSSKNKKDTYYGKWQPGNKAIGQQRWAEKFFILRREQGKCYYCQKKLKIRNMTFDHFFPIGLGGSDALWNRVACCKACNQLKGHKQPWEYFHLLRNRAS